MAVAAAAAVVVQQARHCCSSLHWGLVSSSRIYGKYCASNAREGKSS
jgi:hypothetical protein